MFRIPSLSLPPESDPPVVETLMQCESARLFIDRAAGVLPGFQLTRSNAPAVADICRRLDGMPLAIELAASRVRVLAPDRIAAGLSEAFHLLTGGKRTALARQQTLRASVDWSFDLLSGEERIMLRRLAVFAGSFSLDAAEAVCSGDGIHAGQVLDLLASLVDKSLVHLIEEESPETRYRLLETIRQYAGERLSSSGEEPDVRTRHLAFFVVMVEEGEAQMSGSGFLLWLEMIDTDHDNIRAALDWSVISAQYEQGLRLASLVGYFWFTRGYLSEGRDRCEALLSAAPDSVSPYVRGRALTMAAQIALGCFDLPSVFALAERAMADAETVDDKKSLARVLNYLGQVRFLTGELAEGRSLLERALSTALEANMPGIASNALNYLGLAELVEGSPSRARPLLAEAVETARQAGHPFYTAVALIFTTYALSLRAELARAEQLSSEAVVLLDSLEENGAFRPLALSFRGWIRFCRGDHDGAGPDLDRALDLSQRSLNPTALGTSHLWMGLKEWAAGDLAAAESSLETSVTMNKVINFRPLAVLGLATGAVVAEGRGNRDRARSLMTEAHGILGESEALWVRSSLLNAEATVAMGEGRPERAEELYHEALRLQSESEERTGLIDGLEALAGIAAGLESHVEAARLLGAADASRRDLEYRRFPVMSSGYDRVFADLQTALGPEAFERAREEGAAMSLEEAVAYAQRGRGERKRPSTGWASLTAVEAEVAKLVAERMTNPQIAERLFISRATVKTHLVHIYTKLGISSRLELADEVTRHQATP
jgi:predicted ATPase/DNA-binding CsgD family transcriptional regulator